jgi:hypothetical protein
MEIPLVLIGKGESLLSYRLPAWYRAIMGAMLALILTALALDGRLPGVTGWIFIALLLLALLYEERWDFDLARGELRHRYGLVFLARRVVVPLASVSAFRLLPWVRGTLPGSADERTENLGALAESRGHSRSEDGLLKRKPIYKKPYLTLVCEVDPDPLLLNMVPSRKGANLRDIGTRIAGFCGRPFEEG